MRTGRESLTLGPSPPTTIGDMPDAVSSVVGSIEDIFRYVAPGFVAVGVVAIAFPDFGLPAVGLEDRLSVLLGMGLLAGVILNTCHTALLEDVSCWFLVAWFRCRQSPGEPLRAGSVVGMMRTIEE